MSQTTQPPKIVLRGTKKGDGYTVVRKESFIPKDHFTSLKTNEIMRSFISKDSDGNEKKMQNGKPLWINYIPTDQFPKLQEFCKTHTIDLSVLPTDTVME